jgi:uncharacterized surface protein with fasciclin (FAS1) repeats
MKRLISTLVITVFALLAPMQAQNERDIVETAVFAESFTTLTAALEAAGLVDTLKGNGPFTVFAPTDEAFAKLTAGTVQSLLQDIPALTEILTYHVVAEKLDASQVVTRSSVETVNGNNLLVTVTDGTVKIGAATVITTDVMATNGIIHVIDSVLLP